jgi:hypothetical protein
VPGVLLGGLLFGCGMALARACGARALVLLAGGNLRALVTLLCLGLAAQATLTGVLAPLRQWLQGLGPVTLAHATLAQQLRAGLPPRPRWPWPPACRAGAAGLRPVAAGAAPGAVQLWAAMAIGAGGCRLVDHGPGGRGSVRAGAAHLAELHRPRGRGPAATGRGSGASVGPAIVAGTLAGALPPRCSRAACAGRASTARAPGRIGPGRPADGPGRRAGRGLLHRPGAVRLSTLAFASLPAAIGIAGGASITLRLQAARSVDPQGEPP